MERTLADVLITAELAHRQARTPDYETENHALAALAEAMAESPQEILQKLVETALQLCGADSAGISILEPGGTSGVFRWHAIAGQFSSNKGSHVARDGSPCGVVLERDASLLFSHPERYFDFGMAIDLPIVEALLVPFHSEGRPVGTLWVMAHGPTKKFDSEDQRVLTSLSRFASIEYQVKTTAISAIAAREDVRQILDTAAIGLTRCSRDLRYLSCNPAYEKLAGLSASQIIGRPIIDVIGPEAFEVKRPHFEQVLRGERVEYEEEIPFAIGGPRQLHVVYTPWVKGDRVVGWLASVSDITDLKQTAESLREREQRLRLALNASGAASWMRDARTGRIHWDDRFRKLYGFTSEEPASFEGWMSRVHPDDRWQVIELAEQIQHTKTQDTFDSTFRIVRPDGTVSWIESLGQADRDADGELLRLTGLELDITERRRAEEALQERRDEEHDRAVRKQAEEALRRSHEELERRTLQLSRLASQLTLAEQNARKQLASTLHDGLQQLLFSAVITLEKAVKANSQPGLVELLQRARADVKEAMEAARTLSVSLFPPVLQIGGLPAALAWLAERMQEQYNVAVTVVADPRANPETSDVRILLFEAVRELLFNTVKHAQVDKVDVHLQLRTDDSIDIEVSDKGVGFEPGATLRRKDLHRVGLGLFSIQERLALLGGRLDIQSEPGQGARFRLTLPRTPMPHTTEGSATQRYDRNPRERLVYDSAGRTSKSLRILIADDHPVARAGLRELISERPPLQVVGQAANGVDVISQAMALQPDVIVMDVSMPRMNGIEATREIHRIQPHIRIVGLSTHDDANTERSIREAGAEAYFTKNEGTDRLLDYLLSLRASAMGA